MPNIASLLKDEIIRLARKELRAAADPIRKQVAIQRKEIAALKRDRDQLLRMVKKMGAGRPTPTVEAEDSYAGSSARFSAAGFKTLRKKLGLSAEQMGRLAGVSGQSVYNWEGGHSRPRATQLQQIVRVRAMGKKAAQKALESLSSEKPLSSRKAGRKSSRS